MTDNTEKFTCPRRRAEGYASDNSPFARSGTNLDEWQDRKGDGQLHCSWDGSIHPDQFMDMVRAGKEIGPTDKSYKFYVHEPLSDEQKAASRQHRIDRYVAGGMPEDAATEYVDKNPFHGEGEMLGKFYTHHLSEDQGYEFADLRADEKINWGYPGYAYVPLYIPGPSDHGYPRPAEQPDWMFTCDVCGRKFEAHEELRGTGVDGLREARRRGAEEGWKSNEDTNEDWCPEHAGQATP